LLNRYTIGLNRIRRFILDIEADLYSLIVLEEWKKLKDNFEKASSFLEMSEVILIRC